MRTLLLFLAGIILGSTLMVFKMTNLPAWQFAQTNAELVIKNQKMLEHIQNEAVKLGYAQWQKTNQIYIFEWKKR